MIGSFIYNLTKADYLNFEMLKFKQNKNRIFPSVGIAAIFLIFAGFFVEKDIYKLFIIPAVFLLETLILFIYVGKIKPRKNVEKYLRLDSSYLSKREVAFYSDYIELKVLPEREGDAAVIEVYPYSVMSGIIESSDYFQFITVSEANLLPKKAIPADMLKAVEDTVRKNPNYTLLKNV